MKIGLYGLPTAGKTFILNRIDFLEVVSGSKMLRELCPDFDSRDEEHKNIVRKELAELLSNKESFIMDGHYSFGDDVVFTDGDGELYDVFLYLYISPEILKQRMMSSERNRKYLSYDIAEWQKKEIESLRQFCHMNDKDFYVLDNPNQYVFDDVTEIIDFIKEIIEGYSCLSYAEKCANEILERSSSDVITLMDGDKTITVGDTSNVVFGYTTQIYNGNFYTGYQMWRQMKEFQQYEVKDLIILPVSLNKEVCGAMNNDTYILTSGHEKVWTFMSKYLNVPFFAGVEMSAETKWFITKKIQEAGKHVVAYGDGMNDYYMLKKADKGYLVRKQDKTISRSLKGKDLEELIYV